MPVFHAGERHKCVYDTKCLREFASFQMGWIEVFAGRFAAKSISSQLFFVLKLVSKLTRASSLERICMRMEERDLIFSFSPCRKCLRMENLEH